MKKSQLQKIIKEELARALKEDSPHSIKADLQIYKSELNLLNKIKANRPERKAALEKKIADLEAKLGSR
jgi:BMFP domain-containing protein YqiC